MMELVQDLFILFWCCFVPDVSFGNGWFASSDWPANKRERDVIFDPFLSPRNIICFGTQQAVFSVTRNRFRNRKQLARKGVENSSEVVVFYRGHRGPTRNLAGEGFSRHFRQKTGKIRPFWRGKVAVYRSTQTSKQLVFDRFSAVEDAKFRTDFTNLDVLLRPQFIQLRASNPTSCVMKSWGICPFSAFNSADFRSFRAGFEAVSVPIFP